MSSSISGKEAILGILTVATGIANTYLWRGVIFAWGLKGVAFYSLPVIALFLFAILFSLASAFIRERWLRSATAVVSLAGPFIMIPLQPLVLASAALTAIVGWYAAEEIASEAASSPAFGVRRILRRGLPIFFTAVSLMLTVFYFSAASVQTSQSLLPRSLFDATVPLLESPLQGILPGFRSDASVDELVLALTRQQLGDALDFTALPNAAQNEILRESRKALSRQLGITLTGREQGKDFLYQAANAQIAKFAGPYERYFPYIGALGFFLAVKTLTLPMYWLTLILFTAVVRLLLASGTLKEKTETVQVTKIEL